MSQISHGLVHRDIGHVFINKEHQWLTQPFLVKRSDQMPTVQVQTKRIWPSIHHIKCDFPFKKKKNLRFFFHGFVVSFSSSKTGLQTSNSPLTETSGGKSISLWFGLETSVCTGARACARLGLHCTTRPTEYSSTALNAPGLVKDTQGRSSGKLLMLSCSTFQTVLLVTPTFSGSVELSLTVLCYFLCAELKANFLFK